MPAQLRWGILGTGNIARQFSRGVNACSRGTLAAIGSRSVDAARVFAAEHAVSMAGTYDDVLKDPSIDAVYNALPNSMHHAWTIQALKAGKHVLCEKPFAMNEAEAAEMFDVAEHAGRTVVEAFMYRSNPLFHAVEKAVAGGAIGELRLVRTSFCYRTNKVDGNVRFDRALGGGALMDIGCYCTNFTRHFTGEEPASLSAVAQFHASGVDQLFAGTLQFPGGVLGSFTCGMNTHADNTATICGSEGFIEIPVPWKPPTPEAIYILARGTPPKMDGPAKPSSPPPRETVKVHVDGDLYGIEADDFAKTVIDHAPPAIPRADTLGNMRTLDRLRAAIGLRFND